MSRRRRLPRKNEQRPHKATLDHICGNLLISAFTTRRPQYGSRSPQDMDRAWRWWASLPLQIRTQVLQVENDPAWFEMLKFMWQKRAERRDDGVFVFLERPDYQPSQDHHPKPKFLSWSRLRGNIIPCSTQPGYDSQVDIKGERGSADAPGKQTTTRGTPTTLAFTGNKEAHELVRHLRLSLQQKKTTLNPGKIINFSLLTLDLELMKNVVATRNLIDIASSEHLFINVQPVQAMSNGMLAPVVESPHRAATYAYSAFAYSLPAFIAIRFLRALTAAFEARPTVQPVVGSRIDQKERREVRESKLVLRAWGAIAEATRQLILRRIGPVKCVRRIGSPESVRKPGGGDKDVDENWLVAALNNFLDSRLDYNLEEWSRPLFAKKLEDARAELLTQISMLIGEDLLDDVDAQRIRQKKKKERRIQKNRERARERAQKLRSKREKEQQERQKREREAKASAAARRAARNSLSPAKVDAKRDRSRSTNTRGRRTSTGSKRGRKASPVFMTHEEATKAIREILTGPLLEKTMAQVARRSARRKKKRQKKENKMKQIICAQVLHRVVRKAFEKGDQLQARRVVNATVVRLVKGTFDLAAYRAMCRRARWKELPARAMGTISSFLTVKQGRQMYAACNAWREKILECARKEGPESVFAQKLVPKVRLEAKESQRSHQHHQDHLKLPSSSIASAGNLAHDGKQRPRKKTNSAFSPGTTGRANSSSPISSHISTKSPPPSPHVMKALENTQLLPMAGGIAPSTVPPRSSSRRPGGVAAAAVAAAAYRGQAPRSGLKPNANLLEQAPVVQGRRAGTSPLTPASLRLHQAVLNGIDACDGYVLKTGGLHVVRELHNNVIHMAAALQQLSLERRPWQMAVVNALRVEVTSLWPGARVEVYGSFATQLCAPSSDIDLVVCDVVQHYQSIMSDIKPRESCVKKLANHLRMKKWVQVVQTIERAAVPIVKVTATLREAAGIQLDLSFDSPSHRGLSTCAFVRGLCAEYPMLVPMTLVLKQFLVFQGLNDPYSGGLSSYGLVLMITRVLQRDRLHRRYLQAISAEGQLDASGGGASAHQASLAVSSKQGRVSTQRVNDPSTVFEAKKRLTGVFGGGSELGRLFVTFLWEYGRVFNPRFHAVSVFNHAEESDFIYAGAKYRQMFVGDPLAIIDPFTPTNNIGRTCYGIGQIQSAFDQALSRIEGFTATPSNGRSHDSKHTGQQNRHDSKHAGQPKQDQQPSARPFEGKRKYATAAGAKTKPVPVRVHATDSRTPLGAVFDTLHHSSVVKYQRQLWTRTPAPPEAAAPPPPPVSRVLPVPPRGTSEQQQSANKHRLQPTTLESKYNRATLAGGATRRSGPAKAAPPRQPPAQPMVRRSSMYQRAANQAYSQVQMVEHVLLIAGSDSMEEMKNQPMVMQRLPISDKERQQRVILPILELLEADSNTVQSCLQQLIGFETAFFKAEAASTPTNSTNASARARAAHDAWCEVLSRCLLTKVLTPPSNLLFYRALEKACGERYHGLRKRIVVLSLRCARVLLESKMNEPPFLVASVLSTLGQWLGAITLACDRPLVLGLLDLKAALNSAAKEGRLIAAVPFAVETLSGCNESSVFRMPNPWLSNVLRCLHNIENSPGVAEQVKFSISLLFKRLKVRPDDDLRPSAHVRLVRQVLRMAAEEQAKAVARKRKDDVGKLRPSMDGLEHKHGSGEGVDDDDDNGDDDDQPLSLPVLDLLETKGNTTSACLSQLVEYESQFFGFSDRSSAAETQPLASQQGHRTPWQRRLRPEEEERRRVTWLEVLSTCLLEKVLSPPSNVLFYRSIERACNSRYPGLRKRVVVLSLCSARVLLGLREAGSRFLGASLLTTLGRWIGSITLAINRPIWLRLLDLKGMLVHARGSGSLTTVVPFVVEVMKGCVESKVFRLPNPWVAAVLRCLNNRCQSQDADEELKFCAAVLFKTLRVNPTKDLKEVRKLR